jgi:hypothetical protein
MSGKPSYGPALSPRRSSPVLLLLGPVVHASDLQAALHNLHPSTPAPQPLLHTPRPRASCLLQSWMLTDDVPTYLCKAEAALTAERDRVQVCARLSRPHHPICSLALPFPAPARMNACVESTQQWLRGGASSAHQR